MQNVHQIRPGAIRLCADILGFRPGDIAKQDSRSGARLPAYVKQIIVRGEVLDPRGLGT